MKILYLSTFLILCGAVKADFEENFDEMIKLKCYAQTKTTKTYKELEDAMSNFPSCPAGGRKNPFILNDLSVWCNSVQNNRFYECTDGIIQKLLPCLSEDEVQIRNYILDVFNNTISQICSTTTQKTKLQELLPRVGQNSCILRRFSMWTIFEKCKSSFITATKIEGEDYNLTKIDFCNDVSTARTCANLAMKELCGGDYSGVVTAVLQPHLDWCTRNGFNFVVNK